MGKPAPASVHSLFTVLKYQCILDCSYFHHLGGFYTRVVQNRVQGYSYVYIVQCILGALYTVPVPSVCYATQGVCCAVPGMSKDTLRVVCTVPGEERGESRLR